MKIGAVNQPPSIYFGKPFSYYGVVERIARDRVARMRKLTFLPKMPTDGPNDDYRGYDDDSEAYYDEEDWHSVTSGWERASGR